MTGNDIVKLAFDNLDEWIKQYEAEHPDEHKTTLELAEMYCHGIGRTGE
jgi:hypothetical protein